MPITTDLFNQLLQSYSYPVVSLVAPTHVAYPENKQDAIRIHNMVNDVKEQLKVADISSDMRDRLYNNLLQAYENIDWRHTSAGIAIYVDVEQFHVVYLQVTPEPQVTLEPTFALRDLIRSLGKDWEYAVVVLSEINTRLFRGEGTRFYEVAGENTGFPFVYSKPNKGEPLSRQYGVEKSDTDNRALEEMFRLIGQRIQQYFTENGQVPLFVMGVDRYIAFFGHQHLPYPIAGNIHGSYDFMKERQIFEKVYPAVQRYFEAREAQVFEEVVESKSQKLFAGGYDDVFHATLSGRVETVVLPETGAVPAVFADGALQLLGSALDTPVEGYYVDLVDEIAEQVLKHGGNVLYVDPVGLVDHGMVIAKLRY